MMYKLYVLPLLLLWLWSVTSVHAKCTKIITLTCDSDEESGRLLSDDEMYSKANTMPLGDEQVPVRELIKIGRDLNEFRYEMRRSLQMANNISELRDLLERKLFGFDEIGTIIQTRFSGLEESFSNFGDYIVEVKNDAVNNVVVLKERVDNKTQEVRESIIKYGEEKAETISTSVMSALTAFIIGVASAVGAIILGFILRSMWVNRKTVTRKCCGSCNKKPADPSGGGVRPPSRMDNYKSNVVRYSGL